MRLLGKILPWVIGGVVIFVIVQQIAAAKKKGNATDKQIDEIFK